MSQSEVWREFKRKARVPVWMCTKRMAVQIHGRIHIHAVKLNTDALRLPGLGGIERLAIPSDAGREISPPDPVRFFGSGVPSMLQSCGTLIVRQDLSSNFAASAPGGSPRLNLQPTSAVICSRAAVVRPFAIADEQRRATRAAQNMMNRSRSSTQTFLMASYFKAWSPLSGELRVE